MISEFIFLMVQMYGSFFFSRFSVCTGGMARRAGVIVSESACELLNGQQRFSSDLSKRCESSVVKRIQMLARTKCTQQKFLVGFY